MENLTQRDRVVILLSLYARERDIEYSISNAKRYNLAHLDKLQSELEEILNLQNRIW